MFPAELNNALSSTSIEALQLQKSWLNRSAVPSELADLQALLLTSEDEMVDRDLSAVSQASIVLEVWETSPSRQSYI